MRARKRTAPLLLALSLTAGCKDEGDWVVELVNPSEAAVAVTEVEVYRSTPPAEGAQLVATVKGRASKSLSIPGIYASLRDEASKLGADYVVIELGSTVGIEPRAGSNRPTAMTPVPYVFVNASFYATHAGAEPSGD